MSDIADDLALALDPSRLMARCGLDPDPWQSELLRLQPHRALLLCSRQSGKSTTTAALGLHRALFQPGALVLLLSATQDQSSELLRRVRELFEAVELGVESIGDSKRALELGNGSRVLSLPASPDAVRGYSADLLIADEASYLTDELLVAILPTLAATDGDLIALTTPAGRHGFFFDQWEREESDWHRVRVTAEECPRISASFLADQRQMLGDRAFAREYLCEFTDVASSAFRSEAIDKAFASGGAGRLFGGENPFTPDIGGSDD